MSLDLMKEIWEVHVYAEGPFSGETGFSYTIQPNRWLKAYAEGPLLRAMACRIYFPCTQKVLF
jgi:hypothetical protein